jgi:predicted RNase H-like nuclease (RuvC/YqgF family)
VREQQLSATIAELRSKSEDDDTLSNIELQLEEKRTEESRLRKDVSNKKKEVSTLADTISKVCPSAIKCRCQSSQVSVLHKLLGTAP